MVGTAGELILPRRAKPQPHPEIHSGGDCGACALGGALGLEVADVYRWFNSEGITHVHEMARILRCSVSSKLSDRILDVPAKWDVWTGCDSFGRPAYFCYVPWFNYIRLAIDAGYYAVAMVNFGGEGAERAETNHWVLICGARTKGSIAGEIITGEVLVSCSVRGENWYESRDFLKRMGGYDALLVRPC